MCRKTLIQSSRLSNLRAVQQLLRYLSLLFLRFGNWIYWANIAVPRPDPCQFLLRQRPVESTDLIQKWAIARRQHFCVTFHFVANVVKMWPSSFNLPLHVMSCTKKAAFLRYLSSHSLSDAISNFFQSGDHLFDHTAYIFCKLCSMAVTFIVLPQGQAVFLMQCTSYLNLPYIPFFPGDDLIHVSLF